MSTPAEIRLARRVLRHELEAITGHWRWILALGIVLIVIGTLAVMMPLAATLATALVLGSLLLLGGVAQLVGAFWTRDWSGFFLTLLIGLMYVVLGLMFLRAPVKAELVMTLLLACVLMVGGLFRIIGSLAFQVPALGLDVGRRSDQSVARHPDLAAMARGSTVGDRAVRGDRHHLHRLDLGDAFARCEEHEASDGHAFNRVNRSYGQEMHPAIHHHVSLRFSIRKNCHDAGRVAHPSRSRSKSGGTPSNACIWAAPSVCTV